MINELNRCITLKSWGSVQDTEDGGLSDTELSSYTIWAKVEDMGGAVNSSQGPRIWNYDFQITFRYEKSRAVSEGMTIDYDGKRLTINSIVYKNEGKKDYVVTRCSK